MTGEVKPGDEKSGLIARNWHRLDKRRDELTEATLEGEPVTARFLGEHGLTQVEGTVVRNASGELVVTGWADSVRHETPVPRDAQVDLKSRAW